MFIEEKTKFISTTIHNSDANMQGYQRSAQRPQGSSAHGHYHSRSRSRERRSFNPNYYGRSDFNFQDCESDAPTSSLRQNYEMEGTGLEVQMPGGFDSPYQHNIDNEGGGTTMATMDWKLLMDAGKKAFNDMLRGASGLALPVLLAAWNRISIPYLRLHPRTNQQVEAPQDSETAAAPLSAFREQDAPLQSPLWRSFNNIPFLSGGHRSIASSEEHTLAPSPVVSHRSDSTTSARSRRNKPEPIDFNEWVRIYNPPILSGGARDETEAILVLESQRPRRKNLLHSAEWQEHKQIYLQQVAEWNRKQAEKKEAERKRIEEDERMKKAGRRVLREPLVRKLTPHLTSLVYDALNKPEHTMIRRLKTAEITPRDLWTAMRKTAWLNDEVINGYIEIVVNLANKRAGRDKRSDIPKVIAMNSFFYKNLKEKGPPAIKNWMRRKNAPGTDLLKVETLLIPICQASHWTLAVVQPRLRTIEYLDSYGRYNKPIVANIKAFLKQELGVAYIEEEWKVLDTESPTQKNGYDCGVFLLTNAECCSGGVNCNAYEEAELGTQRERIAAVLVLGGFPEETTPDNNLKPAIDFDT